MNFLPIGNQTVDSNLEQEFFGQNTKAAEIETPLITTEHVEGTQTPPMSPGKRILHVAGSPGRYIKTTLRQGSISSSMFSLVMICLGAGTLTIPYSFYSCGFAFGISLVLLAASMSAFTGYLIAYTSH